jgi:hypothetical protein
MQELADCLGLNSAIDRLQVRDLIILGAGPAGLAAAVYGAAEGLDVLVSPRTNLRIDASSLLLRFALPTVDTWEIFRLIASGFQRPFDACALGA